ncbi:MAG: hypothetical protein ABIZ81_11570 [Opitutaceae bacterium]
MSFVIVRSLAAGSLILLAPLRVAADLPKLETFPGSARSELPARVLAENIAIASPESAARFSPERGYTGDLTLIGKQKPRANPITRPMLAAPAEIPRFDTQLPKNSEGILNKLTPHRDAVEIRFVPPPPAQK